MLSAPPLGVSVWGPASERHPNALPTLEPTSLYVLALVQLAGVHARALTPPTLFHTEAVPSVYTYKNGVVGDVVATTPTAVRTYLREHSLLDAGLRENATASASARAVLAALDDSLSDLVLHTMFSLPPNFQSVTCRRMTQRTTIPSSLPRRMRAAVRARLESPHIGLWGIGGSWDREEKAEAQRWQTTAGLAEARDPHSIMPRTGLYLNPVIATDMREEWERSRLVTHARKTLQAIAAAVQNEFVGGSKTPSSADARLYSLVAPLVLVDWPVDTLPALIRSEFPALVEHTHRMHQLLWSNAAWAFERAPFGPSAPMTWPTWSGIWKSLTSGWRRTPAEDVVRLPATLRYGRMAWIASAIIGPIAWIFLSGLIVIEYVDEDELEEAQEGEVQERSAEDSEEAITENVPAGEDVDYEDGPAGEEIVFEDGPVSEEAYEADPALELDLSGDMDDDDT